MVYRSLNSFTSTLSINRVGKRKRIITKSESQPNYAYSDQTFDDVNTMLVKYFTFRSVQYTISQVYETDPSLMKLEFNWLVDFANKVILLHRPEMYADVIKHYQKAGKEQLIQNLMEVNLALNRNGNTGMIDMLHELQFSNFKEK